MKKSIYVSFTNGKSEKKTFKENEAYRVEINMVEWIEKNHGRIRKINGVYLHDRNGTDIGHTTKMIYYVSVLIKP